MKRLIYILTVFGFLWGAGAAGAQPDAPHARISLVPAQAEITAGEIVTIALRQEIEEGWHSYWINAGDSGAAMRVEWRLPPGFTIGEMSWPVPKKIVTGPLASYGYENEAVILAPLQAPADFAGGPVRLEAEVTTLVCAEICIPEISHHELVLNEGGNLADAAFVAAAQEKMPRLVSGDFSFQEQDGFLLVEGVPDLADGGVLFPHDWGLIDNMAESTVRDGVIWHKRGDRPVRALEEVRFVWAQDGGGIGFTARRADSAAPVKDAPLMAVEEAVEAARTGLEKAQNLDVNLASALLLAFIGGMILNLMPCVFPVLFMKALSLCEMAHDEEKEARIQALLYMAGILLSFAVVAGILMMLRAAGAQIGWGFQLQNPLVIMVLAYLFFIIGLNLAGFFEITGRFAGMGQNLLNVGGKHGHAFFMGVLATIVATPCTAPFMGVAMGYGLTQAPIVALAVFLMLGLGLAFPYVLLSYVPPLRRSLPRPGAWMEVFRRVLAVPIFLTVMWLVWVYVNQTQSLILIAGLVLIIAAAALWRKQGRVRVGLATLLLVIAAGLGVFGVQNQAGQIQGEKAHMGVVPYDAARLEGLLAADGAVFVNMTADWCITCKVNEKMALQGTDFAGLGVTYMVGDWTKQDPAITEFLAAYGRNGVPLYVFYGARKDGKRPEPVILPQLLTKGIVLKTIRGEK